MYKEDEEKLPEFPDLSKIDMKNVGFKLLRDGNFLNTQTQSKNQNTAQTQTQAKTTKSTSNTATRNSAATQTRTRANANIANNGYTQKTSSTEDLQNIHNDSRAQSASRNQARRQAQTQLQNPFASNVKIVGNNVTEKDYDAFFEGFRNGTQKDKAPRFGEMMNGALRHFGISASPQTKQTAKATVAVEKDPFLQGFRSTDDRDDIVASQKRTPAAGDEKYLNYDIESAKERINDSAEWSRRYEEARRSGNENLLRSEYEKLREDIIKAEEAQAKYGTTDKRASQTESRDKFDSRVREQYAARERSIDFSNIDELKNEYKDIEAAERGDTNSSWSKRLERAWNSGDSETYKKIENEMQLQKDRVFDALGYRDYDTIYREALRENAPGIMDIIEALPYEEVEYPYAQRIADKALYDEHTAKGLANMDRARKSVGDMPSSGKISGKAISKLAGQAVGVADVISDAYRVYTEINNDLKDDGKIGWDSVQAVAKVGAGNIGGMAGSAIGAPTGIATFGILGALIGGFGFLPAATLGGFAGDILGKVYGSAEFESRVDAGFDYLKELERRKKYACS